MALLRKRARSGQLHRHIIGIDGQGSRIVLQAIGRRGIEGAVVLLAGRLAGAIIRRRRNALGRLLRITFSGGVGSIVFSPTSPSKPSTASAASANTETFRNESAISRESATATIFPSRQLRASASRCIVFISTNFSLTPTAFSPPCILTFRAVSAIPKTPAIRVMQSDFNIDENSTQL